MPTLRPLLILTLLAATTFAQPPAPPPFPIAPIHGKVLLPDGSPATDILVAPNSEAPNQTALIFLDAKKTAADGTFTFDKAPAGAPVDLYTETSDQKFALALTIPTKNQPGPQDIGTFTLQPTAAIDISLVDAHGKPIANTSINIQPTFGEEGMGNMTRRFTTDDAGHLKADGILPGLHYKINRPGNGNYVDALLIPAPNAPSLKEIVLDDLLRLQVLGADGKSVPVADIRSLTARTDDGAIWSGNSKIIERLPDNTVLLSREATALARPGNPLTLRFTASDHLPQIAVLNMPPKTASLQFLLDTSFDRGYVLSPQPRDLPPDSLGGRVLDTHGNPLPGATFSVPDYTLPIVPNRTRQLALTDSGGAFTLSDTKFNYVQIDKPGFARTWQFAADLPHFAIDISLDDSTHLELDLHRPDGSPAAGATLQAVTLLTPISQDWGGQSVALSATADAAGHIALPIAARTWELRISDNDTFFARLPTIAITRGQTLRKPITLAPGIPLHIHVVDADTGKPIPGVKLYPADHSAGIFIRPPGSERTTDADGNASWPSLMPGNNTIPYYLLGYINHSCDDELFKDLPGQPMIYLDLTPQLHSVTLRLEKAIHISGHIRDAAGKPAPNLRVYPHGAYGSAGQPATTDPHGAYDAYMPLPTNGPSDTTLDIYDPSNKLLLSSDKFPLIPNTEKTLDLQLPR